MAVPAKWRPQDGASSSIGGPRKSRRLAAFSDRPQYINFGVCSCICEFCGAFSGILRGSLRAYNSMFSMPSFGENVDEDVNDNHGPYVFKISGQISHTIGFLSPDPAKGLRFLQLYLFDTENELENRFRAFDGPRKRDLDCNIVQFIVNFLGANNEYVRTFMTSKQMAGENNLQSYAVQLFNNVADRRCDLPSPGSLGCIVSGDDTTCSTYDILIYFHSGRPQRISKLHSSYMPLQYPLLFPHGEEGWSPHLKMGNRRGVTAKNLISPIINASRLFQQYLVDAYTCIEEGRLDYIINHQANLRSDYVSGLHDALSKGDTETRVVGKHMFLPASFTGGPRFMYNHYQDALSICRVYGNPQYFITYTCNVKWPEITRYMDTHGQRDVHSRADIIARVFNIKVHEFINFLKENITFGGVDACMSSFPFSFTYVLSIILWGFPPEIITLYLCSQTIIINLYTIEFQKRGLPHCHTLLWVKSSDRIKNVADVDTYITAELPDPITEPDLYETITTCMIHGPCGPLNQKAPCMKDGKCSKHFPKPFLLRYVVQHGGICTLQTRVIDNVYVVPFCSRFRAHINVEYCGWNMVIKYLFKYISKGADRVRYAIQKAESLWGLSS
uniref:Helitron helicase-like domain-containing protein n=1 Tax=Lactuca sativa TaxID=4236 RepID=A0A9R1UUP5_LACSA|nr:hypothetical protein LSAT_V11C800395800 [Lactuca sativa]